MNGVVILPTHKNKKSGMEEAMDDIRHGRVTEYKDADEMFEKLGVWNIELLLRDMRAEKVPTWNTRRGFFEKST